MIYSGQTSDSINRETISIKYCKECGIREVEKRCIYCSECAENIRYFKMLVNRHNWKKRNPEKFRECDRKNVKKYRARLKEALK